MDKAFQKKHTPIDLPKKDFVATLYNRYGKRLYSYAIHKWSIDEDSAWELVYKTLYKVMESYKSERFESEEKFGSFIFTIFINLLRNYYRDQKKESENFQVTEIDTKEYQNIAEPEKPTVDKNMKLKILNDELDKMEDWQRMLLLMRSNGNAYSEIAKYVDKPEEQLKVYYQRLKQQIAKKLNERL